jgi:hypothetical protein
MAVVRCGLPAQASVSFTGPVNYPVADASRVALGDLDGDDDLDLAVTAPDINSVILLINDSNGVFSDGPIINLEDGAEDVAIGDLDGDGDLDLAVAAHVLTDSGFRGYVHLVGNIGSLTFFHVDSLGFGEKVQSIAIGDLDGDGDLDLVVANKGFNSHSSVFVVENKGSFGFDIAQIFSNPHFQDVWDVAVGDLDGDTMLDLVVANGGAGGAGDVTVFRNDGGMNFTTTGIFPAGSDPRSVAVGDLDGNNGLDLVLTDYSLSDGGIDAVLVLLNAGNFNFAAAETYDAYKGAQSVAIGDLDEDGALDLAVANAGDNTDPGNVSVLMNEGIGVFATPLTFLADDSPQSIAMGDLDGDGRADLVAANGGSNTVSVLLNLPTNAPPICDAGGPYSTQCSGATTVVTLDGSNSDDPDPGDLLTFEWASDCPGASFDDPTSETPTLSLSTSPGCSVNCTATLTVSDEVNPPVGCGPVDVTVLDGQVPWAVQGTLDDCYPTAEAAEIAAVASTTGLADDCAATSDLIVSVSTVGTCSATVTVAVADQCSNSFSLDYLTRIDNTPPEVTCPPGLIVTPTSPAGSAMLFEVQATDDCDSGDPLVICTPPSGSVFSIGTTTVACVSTDDCGNSGSCGFTVTVLTPEEATGLLIEEIEALVDDGTLNHGQGNSFVSKLRATIGSLGRGRTNAACNQLQAFINQVTAFVASGKLTVEEGQVLIDAAMDVRNAAGCDSGPLSEGSAAVGAETVREGPADSVPDSLFGPGCGGGTVVGMAVWLTILMAMVRSRKRVARHR